MKVSMIFSLESAQKRATDRSRRADVASPSNDEHTESTISFASSLEKESGPLAGGRFVSKRALAIVWIGRTRNRRFD